MHWAGFLFLIQCNIRSVIICVHLSAAPGISAEPAEDNLRYFKVLIFGPTSSPYEGMPAPALVAAWPSSCFWRVFDLSRHLQAAFSSSSCSYQRITPWLPPR